MNDMLTASGRVGGGDLCAGAPIPADGGVGRGDVAGAEGRGVRPGRRERRGARRRLSSTFWACCGPQEGSVRVFGLDPIKSPEQVLAGIGYLSEDHTICRAGCGSSN